jgi:hypothetical protein
MRRREPWRGESNEGITLVKSRIEMKKGHKLEEEAEDQLHQHQHGFYQLCSSSQRRGDQSACLAQVEAYRPTTQSAGHWDHQKRGPHGGRHQELLRGRHQRAGSCWDPPPRGNPRYSQPW